MIFLTIGTQEPFDRLISGMDYISEVLGLEVLAQTSANGTFQVRNMKTVDFLNPSEFNELFDKANLVISHAGMGTIITALVKNKHLIVFPRDRKLKEHRSDHQNATAKYFEELGYISVARNVDELKELVEKFLKNDSMNSTPNIGEFASTSLIETIKSEINNA
ncbi:glycosyltransferase [Algoriphagus sp.]|uniref:glycosyltransferase n=1 Tax=Algoriphagus sp. TaxID=1872435 RepID=UPI003F6F759F